MKKRLQKFFINLICFLIPFKSIKRRFRKSCFAYLNKNKIIFVINDIQIYGSFFKIKCIDFDLSGYNNSIYIYMQDGYSNNFYKTLSKTFFKSSIIIKGNNNIIKFKIPMNTVNSCFEILSDNSLIELNENISLNNSHIICRAGKNQFCKIGKNTTTVGLYIDIDDISSCIIGEDCMFSYGIYLRCADGHTVFNKKTLDVINKPIGVLTIGNHCWIGEGVTITKNAYIPNNTIIGLKSVVTKKFTEEYTAIAGNPSKVIKTDVDCDRMNIAEYYD